MYIECASTHQSWYSCMGDYIVSCFLFDVIYINSIFIIYYSSYDLNNNTVTDSMINHARYIPWYITYLLVHRNLSINQFKIERGEGVGAGSMEGGQINKSQARKNPWGLIVK